MKKLTEDKKIEELMKPRYKIIADYPLGRKVGTILTEYGTNLIDEPLFNIGVNSTVYTSASLDKFPAIFKKLEWWEDRKVEDMPEYLKHTLKGEQTTYHKIIRWDMDRLIGYEDKSGGCDIRVWNPEYTYQPATLTEYTHYINQKK